MLVLKYELTHVRELVATDTWWPSSIGKSGTWVSDNDSHFESQVMALLVERLAISHWCVPMYTTCINRTIERLNRDILHVLRVMLLESRLDTRNWLSLLPIGQAKLHHTPYLLRNLPMEKAELLEAVDKLRL
ncbi:Hypothetical protein PHPALM_20741 [Phytophthora palmivora]|uniref:Integrase catalytic domain-containing protein n=1 Tax=Phytophthora palmivora TaxID=4796 RepID=A0A2P4XE28_9STRA|nr:Hypothetical protein PHPALM_20741 [Phytophthora palmivora]